MYSKKKASPLLHHSMQCYRLPVKQTLSQDRCQKFCAIAFKDILDKCMISALWRMLGKPLYCYSMTMQKAHKFYFDCRDSFPQIYSKILCKILCLVLKLNIYQSHIRCVGQDSTVSAIWCIKQCVNKMLFCLLHNRNPNLIFAITKKLVYLHKKMNM